MSYLDARNSIAVGVSGVISFIVNNTNVPIILPSILIESGGYLLKEDGGHINLN